MELNQERAQAINTAWEETRGIQDIKMRASIYKKYGIEPRQAKVREEVNKDGK